MNFAVHEACTYVSTHVENICKHKFVVRVNSVTTARIMPLQKIGAIRYAISEKNQPYNITRVSQSLNKHSGCIASLLQIQLWPWTLIQGFCS